MPAEKEFNESDSLRLTNGISFGALSEYLVDVHKTIKGCLYFI